MLKIVYLCISTIEQSHTYLFGASSHTSIIGDDVCDDSIVAMLLDINEKSFKIYFEHTNNGNTQQISKYAAEIALKTFRKPAILVLSSSPTTDGVSVIEGLRSIITYDIPVYGGMASDVFMEKTYVFTNNEVIPDGLLFVVLDNEAVEVRGLAASGWETIGIEKKVTKAISNIVHTIDDVPTLDLFLKYYDIDASVPIGLEVGTKYPLQVFKDGCLPVLRTPLFANREDKSMTFAGRVPEGASIKFSIQPSFEIIDKTIGEISKLHDKQVEADALLMFSCVGRKIALGPMIEDEILGIRKIWGAPMLGFFTYGEYGNAVDEMPNFHNQTCSFVILKEK